MTSSRQSSEPSSQALPTGTQIEEFVIERVLGSGGFGITYLARDVRLDRQVVIKENLPVQFCFRDPHSLTVAPRHTHGDDAENFRWSLGNFSKEAAMLASLEHPGIVKVLRSFEAFGTAYFVMPFVGGSTLDELAVQRQGKPFSDEDLRRLLERVLAALAYLHQRGIYHRDIKPGNILITGEGIPVLIDFGSARQRLSERSMTVVESPGYTPFEQLQTRGNVGPWSDLYALGATLVKLITGEAPPKTNDRSFGDPWQSLAGRAELKGSFSPGFLTGIDRALKLPLAERWQRAEEWLSALREETVTQPHTATPKHEAEAVSAAESSESASGSERRANLVPWVIGACVVLGLMVAANLTGEKKEIPTPSVVDDAALQQERDKTEAAAAQAREAEQRAVRAEREKEALIAQAKAKDEEVAKEADKQRSTHVGQDAAAAKAEKEKLSMVGSKAGEERDFEIAPGVKITMCWIPPGEFMMGSPEGEVGRAYDETQRRVTLTKGFWLAKTETTQAQWQAVMGSNPSYFRGNDLPVEKVSWNDIAGSGGFIEIVNQTAAKGASRFSLPTEAQWEYACRAGTTGSYAGDLDQMAWYSANSGTNTHPVGGKKANAWGLHDMHGNVWEWCADWNGFDPNREMTDPRGAASGSARVVRGGSWGSNAYYCRAADRNSNYPTSQNGSIGFRIARSSVP